MKGILTLNESVALPRAEYDALVAIANAVLWAGDAPKISFPGAHGYLVPSHNWEAAQQALERLVTPLTFAEPECVEEQTA